MTDDLPPFVDKTLIAPVGLHGIWGSKELEFDPKPDITPLEAVLIAQLFTKMLIDRHHDWREYLDRYWGLTLRMSMPTDDDRLHDFKVMIDRVDLRRHFRKPE